MPSVKDIYVLPRDEFEKKRLNLQQTVVARQFGCLLAPPIEVKDDDKVLDVGCGTGIWSIDLSAQLPRTVQFESCDLSSKNFLDAKSLGIDNIHFSTCSVLHLPKEWTGQFTAVHQRLMHASITISEWRQALQELRRVIKPGGWLQLVEIDLSSFYNDGIESTSKSAVPAQAELCSYWREVVEGADMTWELEARLPSLLDEAGFENVQWKSKIFSTEGGDPSNSENGCCGSLEDDTLACMVNVMKSSRSTIVGTGHIDNQRFDELIEGMANGWKNLPKTEKGNGWKWHLISAQKPLDS